MLGLSIWYRVIIDRGDDAPAALTTVIAIGAAAYAAERALAFVRAFRRPCRAPAELSREWLSGFVILGSLIGFGLWGLFDADSENQWISLSMFTAGAISLALLASWKTKPLCPPDEEEHIGADDGDDP
jgi:hypothetical protein